MEHRNTDFIEYIGKTVNNFKIVKKIGVSVGRFREPLAEVECVYCGRRETKPCFAVLYQPDLKCASCIGRMKALDMPMVGKRFGCLTVIEFSHKGNHRSKYWKCKCDCGSITVVRGSFLRSLKTASCGCKRHDVSYEKNAYHAVRTGFINAHKRSLQQNRPFTITLEDYFFTITQPCHYCGYSEHLEYGGVIGVDRVIPENGYVLNNIVPCCKRCNTAKSAMTKDQFISWVKTVYEHLHTDTKIP